jgi:hypothetical protein
VSTFRPERRPRGLVWEHGGRRPKANWRALYLRAIARITGVPEELLHNSGLLEPVRESSIPGWLPRPRSFAEPREEDAG